MNKRLICPDQEFHPRFNECAVFTQPFEFEDICTKDGYLMPDVYLLRRAQSIEQLYGMSSAKEFLDKVQQAFGKPDSQLTQLRRNMSDDQILMYIKSRNIQTAGEIADWIQYLNAEEVLHSVPVSDPDPLDSKSAEPQPKVE
ncbi:MAG: hypothetical protein IKI72_07965 [Bacteroidales bacterium]|nr:hypothetical protein [Bacteroidales bacterium]